MKILIVSNLYPPFQIGGYEAACKNAAEGLKKRGHDVTVLTSPSHAPGPYIEEEERSVLRNLKLHFFGPYLGTHEKVTQVNTLEGMVTNFINTSNLLNAIAAKKPDCIYFFNIIGIGGLALLDAVNTLNIPWTLHLMDRVPEILQSGFSKSVLSIFNAHNGDIYNNGNIISMSQQLISEIKEMMDGFNFKCPVTFIPGWVDAKTPITKRAYNSNNHTKFISAGAIQPHKGIDIIIDASKLLKDHGINNFSVDIYGEGLVSDYVSISKQKNLADKIKFKGFRSQQELIEIYKNSDAFLFPTWEREPFGFAPIEAASAGCIPIITDRCGASERLVHGVHCIKIKRNPNSLFTQMKEFHENKIDLNRIGQNAQTITRDDLSFTSCLSQIEATLQAIVETNLIAHKRIPNWSDTNLAFLKHNLASQLLGLN